MAEKDIQNATVLAILPAGEDRLSLSAAFADSGWILVFTGRLAEALAVLGSVVVGGVLCDICLPRRSYLERFARRNAKAARPVSQTIGYGWRS